MTAGSLAAVRTWYDRNARRLPWREAGTSAWGVLVSEVMLQQTPVDRVVPVWSAWLFRWPNPADLAAEPAGEAVRQWGRLGYPRRALRLHQTAGVCVERHAGQVPRSLDALLALPGVGAYTARAVAAFAFGSRVPVVDTNVRRVLSRAVEGRADAPVTRSSLDLMTTLLPAEPLLATRTSVAVMELGALVCTARCPRCAACPLAADCAWLRAGRPAPDAPARRPQAYAGTDRQVRGRLLAVLREADRSVGPAELSAAWDEPVQRERALAGLLADGLVQPDGPDRYRLPD